MSVLLHHPPSLWWRHQMETFSALLAICAGNSPVTGGFPAQRPVTRALMFSFICAWINSWVNNREAGDLRRNRAHYDVTVMVRVVHSCLRASDVVIWSRGRLMLYHSACIEECHLSRRFYYHGLTKFMAWKSNYVNCFVSDVIIYIYHTPCNFHGGLVKPPQAIHTHPYFNGGLVKPLRITVGIRVWMSDYIPQFYVDVITYPCRNYAILANISSQ